MVHNHAIVNNSLGQILKSLHTEQKSDSLVSLTPAQVRYLWLFSNYINRQINIFYILYFHITDLDNESRIQLTFIMKKSWYQFVKLPVYFREKKLWKISSILINNNSKITSLEKKPSLEEENTILVKRCSKNFETSMLN